MKQLFFFTVLLLSFIRTTAQTKQAEAPNVFVITIDGLRWQELFGGADEELINNPKFVADTGFAKAMYWHETQEERRKKLMPFFWNMLSSKGQIYGNREKGCKMDVTNKYHFSYPGYNEIFTGYADSKFVPNTPVINKNTNVFEFINSQEEYKDKVVAFSSWNVFPYILNEEKSGFMVNSGYEDLEDTTDLVYQQLNDVQDDIAVKEHTRQDDLTYTAAKEYIKQNHPKVVVLGLGETDEFAHQKKYDQYLLAAANSDRIIAELWQYVQADPFYRGNTSFIITTDHGRGRKASTWHRHLFFIGGSKEVWLAIIGPDIKPLGEVTGVPTIYQNQIASTIACFIGKEFTCEHEVGKPLDIPANTEQGTASRETMIANKIN